MADASSPSPVVRTLPSRAALGQAAAFDIARALRTALARQPRVRAIFAAAPSQAETLAGLSTQPGIDWPRIDAFHMDEYLGLPAHAPEAFRAWLTRHLFALVRPGAVHLIDGAAPPQPEAARYAALLAAAPIDVVCLGIGVNGHLAFNDPPVADLHDPHAVKPVELDATCRQQQVDDGCFPTLGAVPTHALTLTIPRLLDAGRLFCMVPGEAKRAAVTAALHGPLGTACPASALRLHPRCTLYLDEGSTPA